jgi:hypothetical protein
MTVVSLDAGGVEHAPDVVEHFVHVDVDVDAASDELGGGRPDVELSSWRFSSTWKIRRARSAGSSTLTLVRLCADRL